MLTLARAESGVTPAGAEATCDMAACVRTTVGELQTVAALRRVRVEVTAPEFARVAMAGDDCSLVVSNLLLNALQHSPPKSQVQLRLHDEGGTVELAVEDHGDGIEPAVQPRVFDRFYRGDPSRTRSTGGAGLGLAICKAVVERAGGTIGLTSETRKGTTVTVRLPRE